jgi:hypothetical protein
MAEVMARAPLEYIEEHFEYAIDGADRTDMYSSYGTTSKNGLTEDICDAAKAVGIQIYTIAFEASTDGQTVLKNCASSDAQYFDVDGLEISDAFTAIASSIRKLRLTQ